MYARKARIFKARQFINPEFDSRGYGRQLCVDFSPKAVEIMAERHKGRPGIEWRYMDVRNRAE
jgi:hypothetical protein